MKLGRFSMLYKIILSPSSRRCALQIFKRMCMSHVGNLYVQGAAGMICFHRTADCVISPAFLMASCAEHCSKEWSRQFQGAPEMPHSRTNGWCGVVILFWKWH